MTVLTVCVCSTTLISMGAYLAGMGCILVGYTYTN